MEIIAQDINKMKIKNLTLLQLKLKSPPLKTRKQLNNTSNKKSDTSRNSP